jgi:hypothetical protein
MKKNQIIDLKKNKIFRNTLGVEYKTAKSIGLKSKKGIIGNMKYLPSFSKEWKNIIYSFNKNNLKNLPINNININKIIQSYFNLFFKQDKFIGFSKFRRLRKRRTFLRKIFVSNAEIKHTNNKVKITLFTLNREKKIFKEKYIKLLKKMSFELLKRYIFLYKNYILNLYSHLNNRYKIRNNYFFYYGSQGSKVTSKNYLKHKFNYLSIFLILNNLLLKKIWSYIIKNQAKSFIKLLRKYNLLYSLNHYKFNKLVLLPKLSNLLGKIVGKKIDYNIINLKSMSYNTDIFTKILALKIRKIKHNHVGAMLSVLNKAYLPKVNTIQERTKIQTWDNLDLFQNKYKNLNILSNIKKNYTITNVLKDIFSLSSLGKGIQTESVIKEDKPLSNKDNIHNIIFNSIQYKNMSGIQIEVKGRLTKRYRADRSVFNLRRKGGLKNISSSFNGLSSILFRGNTKSNISYSFSKSKRRVGAFAVKGWIGGK